MRVLWWLAAVGLVIVARSRPPVALFGLALFGLLMVGAATSHLVEGRLRYPIDVMAAPLVATGLWGLMRLPRWVAAGRTRRSPSPG